MKKCEISINQLEIEQKTQQTLVLPALHITDKSKDEGQSKGLPGRTERRRCDKNLRRGESIFHQKGNVVFTIWKDKKAVAFISTQCEAKGTETVNRRQKDGSIVKVDFLPVVTIYNKFMGGVDKADQYWQYYEVTRLAQVEVVFVLVRIGCSSLTQLKFRV
ncbi:predicted protein [Nematostella vectensis]|uniref:PiggyBac transposable element-derived protein domain-containing protein n=1 Tax=Nematostella vectensis TaxID=45351 RepID=A7SZ00_NEMVE|nr:predicted protein [Nematostella vectensis]|eukprot:XP_001623161.1 predicted protein [Nematostella vectensis]